LLASAAVAGRDRKVAGRNWLWQMRHSFGMLCAEAFIPPLSGDEGKAGIHVRCGLGGWPRPHSIFEGNCWRPECDKILNAHCCRSIGHCIENAEVLRLAQDDRSKLNGRGRSSVRQDSCGPVCVRISSVRTGRRTITPLSPALNAPGYYQTPLRGGNRGVLVPPRCTKSGSHALSGAPDLACGRIRRRRSPALSKSERPFRAQAG